MRFILSVFIILTALIPVHSLQGGQFARKISMDINLDKTVFKTGAPQKAVLKLSVKSEGKNMERVPVNLVILIDKSGSMEGAKIQMACKAAIYAAQKLNDDDIISVVTYGNSVEAVIPAGTKLNNENIKIINNIQSSGNTALFSGLSRAIFELRKNLNKKFINRIIVISDGFANIGIKGVEDYERLGASLRKEEISVSTIGIGEGYNEDLMVALSKNSSGNSYFAEDPNMLMDSFKSEMDQLLSIVARRIAVTINLENGIKPLRIVGREGRVRGNKITLNLSELSRSRHKFVLVEIMVPLSMGKKEIVIAKASVKYEDPVISENQNLEGIVTASYSDREVLVKESRNIDVKRSYLKNLNAISTERALKLFDQGKKTEAVKVMEQTSRQLSKAAEEIEDKEVEKEVMELEKSIKEVKKEGKLSNKKRKVIKMKSFETMTQQAK